jgi:acyl-CoA reductase-like NAD-dependent aldehyde dehydrogenase
LHSPKLLTLIKAQFLMSSFQSINPFNEKLDSSFPFFDSSQQEDLLKEMQKAQSLWKKNSISERIAFLPQLAKLLRENADELGKVAALEMGKTFTHAKAEVIKSASLCDYYYSSAESILKPKIEVIEQGSQITSFYEPLGIVLGIFPWNFPYWQILRSAIPTVVSGNSMLVKPAPNVPKSSILLQQILVQTELPKNLFVTAFFNDEQIAKLITHNAISAVTLTGSEKAGSIVASLAAKEIKPAVLELGGSDPLILFADAPLEKIIDQIVFSRFQNNGQSCVAAKRFLVEEKIADKFLELLIQKISQFKLGDPLEEGTDIGPLARKDLRDLLFNQVKDSVNSGAKIAFQQNDVPEIGYFYPPTILTNIPKACRAYEEELFGPVLSLYTFTSVEEAIAIANDTKFGLGASIFTSDLDCANKMATDIESGMVYINQIVKSDVQIPFGGSKHSGFGRELGPEGLKAFCQVKTVWQKL